MLHQRTLIRRAVRDRLIAAATSAGSRVYAGRYLPFRENELAALAVYTPDEDVEDESASSAPRELTRSLPLVIEGIVRPASGALVDEAIDAFALQVEAAMHADRYLGASDTVEAVDAVTDELTLTAHEFVTGQAVRLSSTVAVPGGLSATREYYAIVVDANKVKLALSRLAAEAGIAVDITSAGSGVIALATDMAADSILSGTVTEVLEQGGRELGWFALTYLVKYQMPAPVPATGMDEFETVEATFDLGGVQAPADETLDEFTVEAP